MAFLGTFPKFPPFFLSPFWLPLAICFCSCRLDFLSVLFYKLLLLIMLILPIAGFSILAPPLCPARHSANSSGNSTLL